MVWLDWMIIACVVLLAAVLFTIWRERQHLAKDLDAEAQDADPFSAATDDAERDQRPVEAYRGAAEQMSSAGPRTSSRYQLKFEQMRRGAGDEDALLWETLATLAFADQAKVPHGLEHFQGVSQLAAQIAMQMRLSEAEIEEVRVAGIVHDIGKTHVPDPVRLKVKLLTAEEFQIMKNHADWGARILEPLGEEGIARIVRHHHERYDGTGYPDHLKGEDIPLGARIVGLAECFDAMISDLDYKAPRTFDDAVAEVRRCSGTQFDPKVVRAFLNQV